MKLQHKKNLLLSLALSLTFSFYATATAANAQDYSNYFTSETFTYNSKDFATIYTIKPHPFTAVNKSTYDITEGQYSFIYDAVKSGLDYWGNMLAANSKNTIPWQIVLSTSDDTNASAGPENYLYTQGIIRNLVQEYLQTGSPVLPGLTTENLFAENEYYNNNNEYLGFSIVQIGKYLAGGTNVDFSWSLDADTLLPTNEEKVDLVGTVRHELGHALGIAEFFPAAKITGGNPLYGDAIETTIKTNPQDYLYFYDSSSPFKYPNYYFPSDSTANSWAKHLVDQNGNHSQPGMKIVTNATFQKLQAEDPSLKTSDFFIVDDLWNITNFDVNNLASGYAYFVGDNVTEALDGATFYGMSGLPVNAWEPNEITLNNGTNIVYCNFEGSHLNTPGLMSHRSYCNYTTFMEVELAAMQDLGYTLDRKAYYGRSIYGNNGNIINTQGYSARNADGTAYLPGQYSEVPLGIGLHVFGSRNTITQKGDILTRGTGAAGMRIDGVENKITVAEGTQIHADGQRGIGILTAYGRDHEINVAGTVTALGTGGNALVFDFGGSSNGARDEYRGSYIRYKRWVNDSSSANPGTISSATNMSLTNADKDSFNAAPDELIGALSNKVTISGTVAGAENAILISKNAFVKAIDIADGAKLEGNITSNWKHFTTADGSDDPSYIFKDLTSIKIQYKDNFYDVKTYIPDLVTQLNFNTNLTYSGNITGTDNMKLNVNSGTLNYGGTTNVVSINVADGATLLGGSYTVNDMTASMASGFSDDNTGKFIVSGTIGANASDANMSINGDLVLNEGATLVGYAGGADDKGIIEHTGTNAVNLNGVTLKLANALPQETHKVLQTNMSVSGSPTNDAAHPTYQSALLNVYGAADGASASVTAVAANNLGETTSAQQATYAALNRITVAARNVDNTYSEAANVLRPLYNMNATATKAAFDRISSNNMASANIRLGQQSQLVHSTLGEHLDVLGTKADGVKPDDRLWLKLGKSWGDLRTAGGTADYHGSSIMGGYDLNNTPGQKRGLFLAFNKTSAAEANESAKLQDTRVGYYGSQTFGPASIYYYGDLGYQRNKTKRALYSGVQSEGKPESYLAEIGGEYKYDLNYGTNNTWHVAPYAGFTASVLRQKAYTENGASLLSQSVEEKWNTYANAQGGVELVRKLPLGSYGLRAGVVQHLAGTDPDLKFNYVGDSVTQTLSTKQDRTQLVLKLFADAGFAHGWYVNAEASLQRGAHDKDFKAAVQVQKKL